MNIQTNVLKFVLRSTRFPGLSEHDFEQVIHCFIEDVIGWDTSLHKSKGTGAFGDCVAWLDATEEQGRKTLHAHFLIWIKDWEKLL